MTTRDRAPLGAPCWADLSTTDVEGSRRFYGELFGWEAGEPAADFGGYFMWMREGVPVAGGMGSMGDPSSDNLWKAYLSTDDIEKTIEKAKDAGGQALFPAMPVADLGTQTVLIDGQGACIGLWQPGTFSGFSVIGEPGAPSWFELHSSDHAGSLAFYRDVVGWEANLTNDTDEFRYALMSGPEGGDDLAGIMDSKNWREGSAWNIYWHTPDIDASCAKVAQLGGKVTQGPDDTPYGKLAVALDPAGAEFRLHTP